MDDVLQEIRFIPGILGSFVYVDKLGVVSSDLPAKYDTDAVRQMGRVFSRLFAMRSSVCQSTQNVDMGFDDLILTSCKIHDDAAVVTLGDSTVNADFISMTVGSLTRDLISLVDGARAEARNAPATTNSSPIAESNAAPAPSESDVGDGLQPVFSSLQTHLAAAVGPAAAIVMKDAVARWAAEGPSSPQRLDELLERLCSEIEDPTQERMFHDAAESVIKTASGTGQTRPSPTGAAVVSMQDLKPLEGALAVAVGPVAGMILADAAAKWRSGGGGTSDGLDMLVDNLCREIGDAALEAAFRKQAQPLVQSLSAPATSAESTGNAGRSAMSGEVEAAIDRLREPLTRAIGPISQVVMGDAVAVWCQGGGSAARLGLLVDRLCEEISDDQLARGFRKEVEGLLPG